MSFLPLSQKPKVLILFTRIARPACLKEIKGFNHCAIAFFVDETCDHVFIVEPALQGANVALKKLPLEIHDEHTKILEIDLEFTFTQKLFRDGFQTCATLVQYLAGIDLKAVLAQTLYDRLTNRSEKYLKRHGIVEVTEWA